MKTTKMSKTVVILSSVVLLMACTSTGKQTDAPSTIDSDLQAKVTSVLKDKLEEMREHSGRIVLMEVQTGQVKAMAKLDKDDNPNSRESNDFDLVCPTQLSAAVSLLAGLESGNIHLSDKIDVGNGVKEFDGNTIFDHNWHRGGYGEITVLQGFAFGSDIAEALCLRKAFADSTDYTTQLSRMGINDYACTGNREATPAQMLAFYNAIANNGVMVQPQFHKEDSVTVINPQIAGQAGIDSLKLALEYVVTDGMGKPAQSAEAQVAGKTSRAQLADGSYVAEFCGYFPVHNPQYTILVSINRKELPVSGGQMAGSVFKEIVEYMADNHWIN